MIIEKKVYTFDNDTCSCIVIIDGKYYSGSAQRTKDELKNKIDSLENAIENYKYGYDTLYEELSTEVKKKL